MTAEMLRSQRLHNQWLLHSVAKSPAQVVAHLGAMQAQEYAMAKWAIGLRFPGSTDAVVARAFQSGDILRTHLLRPTWHFVVPADIRWLLTLSAPQVHRLNGTYYRKWNLDAQTLSQAEALLMSALAVQSVQTRAQLSQTLAQGGIPAEGQRLAYILMHAELEGLICSGPRVGKQFTYTLLERVAPLQTPLPRAEALVRLATRYFASRGPATVEDFAYWSGLSLRDAHAGSNALDMGFIRKGPYIAPDGCEDVPLKVRTFLLPDYDEYGMGYRDRSALSSGHAAAQHAPDTSHWLVVAGTIDGTWTFPSSQHRTPAQTHLFTRCSRQVQAEVDDALADYAAFWTQPEGSKEKRS